MEEGRRGCGSRTVKRISIGINWIARIISSLSSTPLPAPCHLPVARCLQCMEQFPWVSHTQPSVASPLATLQCTKRQCAAPQYTALHSISLLCWFNTRLTAYCALLPPVSLNFWPNNSVKGDPATSWLLSSSLYMLGTVGHSHHWKPRHCKT